MRNLVCRPRAAGIVSVILALILLLSIYVGFARMDLVYMSRGQEVYRQEGAYTFSEYDYPPVAFDHDGSPSTADKPLNFHYTDRGLWFEFEGATLRFRFRIAKTVFKNLITFKWDESNYVMVLQDR